MRNSAAIPCSRSVSTLSTISRPAISLASASTSGAAILQGPHQSAQKSTRIGTCALCSTSRNISAVASMGAASGGNSALQDPQRPLSVRCLEGTRFDAPHAEHFRSIILRGRLTGPREPRKAPPLFSNSTAGTLSEEFRRGRSDRGSSLYSTQPRSPSQTSLSSRQMHRIPRLPEAGHWSRRRDQQRWQST
jgi:hypothetical protein